MKRTLIAAAAVLAAGTAFAQSSVTIYGRVNTTVEHQKLATGNVNVVANNASRWGLRGSEDLGGGLKGLFVLESGFQSDTGVGNANGLFARESWVGVQGNFGRVRLGNMAPSAAYFTIADYISMHNHDTGTSEDALYLYAGRAPLTNAIAYNTPSFGGLVVEAQYGLKEQPSGVAAKNVGVLTANYDRGSLHLGASYLTGGATTFFTGPTAAADVTAIDNKEYGLRALYELGSFTVGAYAVRNTGTIGGVDYNRNAYRLSGMFSFGASELHVNVGKAQDISAIAGDQSALQYTVGYNYNLSKRTKVYAYYTKIDNKDGAAYGRGEYGRAGVANGFDPSSVAIGVRHNF